LHYLDKLKSPLSRNTGIRKIRCSGTNVGRPKIFNRSLRRPERFQKVTDNTHYCLSLNLAAGRLTYFNTIRQKIKPAIRWIVAAATAVAANEEKGAQC